MSIEKSGTSMNRRGFLRGVATAGGAVAASGLIGESANAVVPTSSPQDDAGESSKGYRITPHILEYYEKARF